MSAAQHVRVFLASPGDVLQEREIALEVLANLAYDPHLRGRVTIEDVAWDKKGAGAPILAGITPQDSIGAGLPRPGECSIVVVIFWSRMGTPLPPAYRKADGSRYESGTEWEYEDAVSAYRERGAPLVLLYRRTEPVLFDPDAADFQERVDQRRKVKAFFASLVDADGSARGGFTPYESPSEFRERLEHDLKSLIKRIVETRKPAEPAALPEPWPGSPFPGLRAFTAEDAPIFFGREREIDAVVARVMEQPVVAVVGASGSGKSSLVAAGVIPRLQLMARANGEPPWAVAHFDQFEEIFTTVSESERERRIAALGNGRAILTVRADFYAHCVEHPALARLIENSTFPLAAPGVAALYDMITKPAARAMLELEEALAQRILDDTGQEPGALALMAYTLDELYRRAGESRILTHAAYEELGGVQGAIGKRSETVFAALADDERAAFPRVFRELVEVDERGTATRRRAPLGRVTATPAAKRLTEALTGARLLVRSRGENNEPTVEVAHEALFRSWSRLAEWIRETQDDLRLLRQVRTAAMEWDANGRRDHFLWSHERLAPVYALQERMAAELDPVVRDFIRPEFERLVEIMRGDPKYMSQRRPIERLEQIGAPAAGTLVECLQYAQTLSARMHLERALRRLGAVAVPPLLEAASAKTFQARPSALEILSYIDPAAANPLLPALLKEPDSEVWAAAARLAAYARNSDMIPLLRRFRWRRDEWESATVALATFHHPDALAGLLEAAASNALPIQFLYELATGAKKRSVGPFYGTSYVRLRRLVEANTILEEPESVELVIQTLGPILRERDTFMVSKAAKVLGALKTPNAIATLRRELHRAQPESAGDILGVIVESRDPGAIDDVLTLLRSDDPYRSTNALHAVRNILKMQKLRKLLLETNVGALVQALLGDKDTETRETAQEVYADLEPYLKRKAAKG